MAIDQHATRQQLVEDLTYAYGELFSTEEINVAFNEAWELLGGRAKIQNFLPVLVARRAAGTLAPSSPANGTRTGMSPILPASRSVSCARSATTSKPESPHSCAKSWTERPTND